MLTPSLGRFLKRKMKKIVFIIFVFLCTTLLFSQEYIKKYSETEEWFSDEAFQGLSIFEVQIQSISKKQKEITATVIHTITPFSQVLYKENLKLKKVKEKYKFEFIDSWNNKVFGWLILSDENPKLYLDCKKFSMEGKRFGRLYGATVTLHDTTNDRNYFQKSLDKNNEIKNILNKKNSKYFPVNENGKYFSVLYLGLIKGFNVFKTTLVWNLDNSRRMTTRLVFIKEEEIVGMYAGMQSQNIRIENNKIIFEDIESNNIIEIGETLPEQIYMDREFYYLEK